MFRDNYKAQLTDLRNILCQPTVGHPQLHNPSSPL